jgi:hypothetical protein
MFISAINTSIMEIKMKYVVLSIMGFVGVIALTWVLGFHSVIYTRVIGGAQEDARRHVFEHSKAYRDGVVQELQNMQFEYLRATPEQQQALAPIIKRRAASISQSELPDDLLIFIRSL